MARDYSREYERRNERAQEAGWDSFNQQRNARTDARETAQEFDADWSSAEVEAYAEFVRDWAPGDYDYDTMRDFFDTFFPDQDDDAYHAWLQELYG